MNTVGTSNTQAIYQSLTSKPGYRPRDGQRQMADVIATTLSPEHLGKKQVIAEAATGTGKTFAYLAGAYPAAHAADKTLVIATATIGLQEQLLSRDIPLFEAAWGDPIKATIAKGRGRYVCDRALLMAGGQDPAQTALPFGDEGIHLNASDLWTDPPTPEQRDQMGKLVLARSAGWNGDMDAPPLPFDATVRSKITIGQAGCAGRACPAVNRCAYRLARREGKLADIVVTNHDLLLTDVSLGGGVLLPAPEDTILIIDEAHALQETAIDRLTHRLTFSATDRTLGKLPLLLQRIDSSTGASHRAEHESAVQIAISGIREGLEKIAGALAHRLGIHHPGMKTPVFSAATVLRRWNPSEWPDVVEQIETMARECIVVMSTLKQHRDRLSDPDKMGIPSQVAADMTAQVGLASETIRGVGKWAEAVVNEAHATGERSPTAIWVEAVTVRGRAELVAVAAPTQVAGLLRSLLFDRLYGVVLTSATLRTLGNFDHLMRGTGLSARDGTQCVAIDSPYDLARQASLIVPASATDPKDTEHHTKVVLDSIVSMSSADAGTLVLFTSRKQMQTVFDALPEEVRAIAQVPGTESRASVLKSHRARVACGEPSILFGLESFAAGLDLPGRECETVIITRLPFAPPDGPIAETLSEWLQSRGRSFFLEEAIPDAYRRLVQRMGRLIRSETDSGRIYILDRRIISTTYGKRMWNALPGYTRVIEPVK